MSRSASTCVSVRLLCLLYLSVISSPSLAQVGLLNVTVDDQNGDPITGIVPTYSPPTDWAAGEACKGCAIQFSADDRTHVYEETWHDATHRPTDAEPVEMIFQFTGVAVYLYCILVSTYDTHLQFVVDGQPGTTNFDHYSAPTTQQYTFSVPVFSATSLTNAAHEIRLQSGGSLSSLVLFDYLIYTNDTNAPSSSSALPAASSSSPSPSITNTPPPPRTSHANVGAIAGGVVAGLALSGFIAMLSFIFIRRRQHAKASRSLDLDGSEKGYNVSPEGEPPNAVPSRQELLVVTENHDDEDSRISPFTAFPPPVHSTSSTDVTESVIASRRSSSPDRSGKRQATIANQIREKEEAISALQRRETLSRAHSGTTADNERRGELDATLREMQRLRCEVEQLRLRIAHRPSNYDWEHDSAPPIYDESDRR